MKHVVLFGGSFNPVHDGHMEIAKQALIQRNADEVWFVVNQMSPFKDKGTSFEHRFHMLEMMLANQSKKFRVCRTDETLPSPSYAINTVEALNKKHSNIHFDWLIGSDQIAKLDQWHRFDEFKEMVTFVVYERDLSEHPYPKIKGEALNVSSTLIRTGKSVKTHINILNYMMSEGLYLDDMLKKRLSEFRYEHTLRVTKLALRLAQRHHVNEKQVYLAAMFHDYSKEDFSDAIFEKQEHPAFDHAYAASSLLSKRYYVKDKTVLSAIRNHVNGTATNKVAQILFIADKCEPGRNFDSSHLVALAMNDLNKGFKAVKESNHAYLRKEDK